MQRMNAPKVNIHPVHHSPTIHPSTNHACGPDVLLLTDLRQTKNEQENSQNKLQDPQKEVVFTFWDVISGCHQWDGNRSPAHNSILKTAALNTLQETGAKLTGAAKVSGNDRGINLKIHSTFNALEILRAWNNRDAASCALAGRVIAIAETC